MKLMTNRKVVLALMSGVIAVALVGNALATDTKALSTSGSLLITSDRELDAFPHMGMAREASASMTSGYTDFYDSPARSDHGNARLLVHLNDDAGLLVNLNNEGFGHRIRNYSWGSFGYGSDNPYLQGQVLDADYLKENFSVGVSLGMAKNVDAPDHSSFGGRASFTNGEGMHVAGEVTMVSPDGDGLDSGFLASALYRGEYDNGWTAHAAVYMEKPVADEDADVDTELGLMLSAGQRLVNTDRNQVVVEGIIDFVSNPVYTDMYSSVLFIPGARVGVVHELTGMLDIHGGIVGSWSNASYDDGDEAPGVNTLAADEDRQGFFYNWTVGLGANFGMVTLDLNVHPEAIPTLTRFGSEDHMFGEATVKVVW